MLSRRQKQAAFGVWLVSFLFVAWYRWRLRDVPLENNVATYVTMGRELLLGKGLYSEIWDVKPPGIYLAYAAAVAVSGYSSEAIFLVNAGLAALTLAGVYFAGSLAGFGAGITAMALWAVCSGDANSGAFFPEPESFMNCAFAWAVFAFARFAREPTLRRALIFGALVAAGSFFKQQFLFVAFFFVLAWFVSGGRNLKLAAACFAPFAGLWVLVFGYFAATGRLQLLNETLFVYSNWYRGDLRENFRDSFREPFYFFSTLKFYFPILLAAPIAALRSSGMRETWLLVPAAAAAIWLGIMIPGHLTVSRYQLWALLFCLCGAWTVTASRVTAAIAGAGALFLAAQTLPFYFSSPQAAAQRVVGPFYVEQKRVGEAINSVLEPGESFYVWGIQPGLYFHARKRPASGVLWNYHTTDGPLKAQLAARVRQDLEREEPTLIVIHKSQYQGEMSPAHPVPAWFLPRFKKLEREPAALASEEFDFWVREGSQLEKRLSVF